MSEGNEPSYYEIALTNRQVLVSFVVLLGCVLSAFVAGVWVGRLDRPPQVADAAPASEPEVGSGELAGLEEFQFPSEEGDGLQKPDLRELRGDAESEKRPAPPPPRQRDTPSAGDAVRPPPANPRPRPSPPPSAPPPAPPARQAPPPPRAAPPAAAADQGGFIIQVFSSRDEAQAKKVVANLRRGGHQAYLSPVEVGGQTMHRVRIGPFDRQTAADQAAAEIRSEFKLETWVTAASN